MLPLLAVMALAAWLVTNRRRKNVAKNRKLKKPKIVVVQGTVLSSDAQDRTVIVSYPQGENVTRTFTLNESVQDVPKTGETILVAWPRDLPLNAYIMPLHYSPVDKKDGH